MIFRVAGCCAVTWALLIAAGCSSSARFSHTEKSIKKTAVRHSPEEKSVAAAHHGEPVPVDTVQVAAIPMQTHPPAAETPRKKDSYSQKGIASYYAPKFHGRRTASGERYDMNGLTAAHRSLAFGTRLKVTNLSNQRSVVVRVNDRGPHIKKRIIDVSYAAARKLGLLGSGTARVLIEVVEERR
jgi:rare lipoprotein A